ncbi:MAG: DUF362 domain-containing protein [Actinobacteria bacterium]|nr:DUF362 domain-containing protein [Actinomycetota bacterium]
MRKVSIVKCDGYEFSPLDSAIRKAVELAVGSDLGIKPGDKVLIKPNMLCRATPDKAITTHPEFVRSVIRLVREHGGDPVVGDSPGILQPRQLNAIWEQSGIRNVCDEEAAKLVSFEAEYGEVDIGSGKLLKKIPISKEVLDSDYIITLPKLKTHGFMFFTGGIKIIFGCVPGHNKFIFHIKLETRENFANMLIDLYSAIKPNFVILDSILAMEGNGPSNGDPRHLGLIFASRDSLALDVVASSAVGYDPWEVFTNRAAMERGLISNMNEIEVVGESLDDIKVDDFKKPISREVNQSVPRFLWYFMRNIASPKPVVIHDVCEGCSACLNSCPAKAMYSKDSKIYIDYDKCIRCYCCDEVCLYGSIELKPHPLTKPFLSRKNKKEVI